MYDKEAIMKKISLIDKSSLSKEQKEWAKKALKSDFKKEDRDRMYSVIDELDRSDEEKKKLRNLVTPKF